MSGDFSPAFLQIATGAIVVFSCAWNVIECGSWVQKKLRPPEKRDKFNGRALLMLEQIYKNSLEQQSQERWERQQQQHTLRSPRQQHAPIIVVNHNDTNGDDDDDADNTSSDEQELRQREHAMAHTKPRPQRRRRRRRTSSVPPSFRPSASSSQISGADNAATANEETRIDILLPPTLVAVPTDVPNEPVFHLTESTSSSSSASNGAETA